LIDLLWAHLVNFRTEKFWAFYWKRERERWNWFSCDFL